MRCIQLHSSFPSLNLPAKHSQELIRKQHKLLNPCSRELTTSTSLVKIAQRMPTRPSVITNPLILAETSPVFLGDIWVLLRTGGLLLFIYGLANFVVPAFIFKSDESTVPDNGGSSDDDEASKPNKKRSF